MAAQFDPVFSEFPSQEEADSYDLWFRAKVQGSLRRADDPTTPRHSTDEVMRRIDTVIQAAETKRAQRRLA